MFRKKEKIRAERARQEFVESYQNIVKMEQQEENEEVKKLPARRVSNLLTIRYVAEQQPLRKKQIKANLKSLQMVIAE